jgi:hypothetical protein
MKRTPLKRGDKPLRADPQKQREWQERSRKPLKSGDKAMARTTMKSRPSKRKVNYEAELDVLTPALIARSGGYCEARIPGVCQGEAHHRHHRQVGRFAGSNSLENLLHLDFSCHDHIHLHPSWSREMGYLVKRTDNPADIPWGKLRKIT